MAKKEESKKGWKIVKALLFIFIIIGSTLLYARFIGTYGLEVNEYKITNTNLPESFNGLKIVHITDTHYGRTFNKKQLNNLISKLNLIKPDIIVITGDLLDRDTKLTDEEINDLTSGLKKMNATIGKYAIMGNHDYSHEEWASIISNSGFTNLDDTYDIVYDGSLNPILLAGMSTNLKGETSIGEKVNQINNYYNLLGENPEEKDPKFKILLMHEPDYIDQFDYSSYNLILAGHSHNGQVRLPIIGALILPEGSKKYYKNYYKLNNTDLYISSGLGTSTVNFRLFDKPSINLYRLTNN